MKDIKIIDDFLNKEEFNKLSETLLSKNFPWFYSDRKVKINGIEHKENFQFTHVFLIEDKINSVFFKDLTPLFVKLNVKKIVKLKANLTIFSKEQIVYGMHTDTDFNCNTAIYYLNTNNGKTIFENGKKINSIENRIVIFNSQTKHSALSHTDIDRRVVLNINYMDY